MGGRPEKNKKHQQPGLDEHIANEDKQHLKANDRNGPGSERGPTADEKLDEALQESFPASDPPAQP